MEERLWWRHSSQQIILNSKGKPSISVQCFFWRSNNFISIEIWWTFFFLSAKISLTIWAALQAASVPWSLGRRVLWEKHPFHTGHSSLAWLSLTVSEKFQKYLHSIHSSDINNTDSLFHCENGIMVMTIICTYRMSEWLSRYATQRHWCQIHIWQGAEKPGFRPQWSAWWSNLSGVML